jgi:N-acetylmuramic acid 6-phosphate etherase
MITTASMIQLGHVKGNKMVDMKLSNDKLIGRAERIVMDELNISLGEAQHLLKQHNNVRAAIDYCNKS